MKCLIYFALLLLITSCSNTNQESIPHSSVEESPEVTAADNADSEDCIFDQETQTDEFLKNIEKFKAYQWDQASRTATINLQPGDTLIITRGGCDHFTVAAEFRLSSDDTDYSNWSNVYRRALWIAEVLDKEFFYYDLKAAVDSGRVVVENYPNADITSFESEALVDNGYQIERRLLPGKTIIVLSKTII